MNSWNFGRVLSGFVLTIRSALEARCVNDRYYSKIAAMTLTGDRGPKPVSGALISGAPLCVARRDVKQDNEEGEVRTMSKSVSRPASEKQRRHCPYELFVDGN